MKNIIVAILLGAALLGAANAQEGKAPAKHGHGAPVPSLHQGHKAHHGQRHHWGKPGMRQHKGIQKDARKPAAPVAKCSIADHKAVWGEAFQKHQAGKGKNIRKHAFKFGPKHQRAAIPFKGHGKDMKPWGKGHASNWGKKQAHRRQHMAWGKKAQRPAWGKKVQRPHFAAPRWGKQAPAWGKKGLNKNGWCRKGNHKFSWGKRGFHKAGAWGRKFHQAPGHAARFGRHSRNH